MATEVRGPQNTETVSIMFGPILVLIKVILQATLKVKIDRGVNLEERAHPGRKTRSTPMSPISSRTLHVSHCGRT